MQEFITLTKLLEAFNAYLHAFEAFKRRKGEQKGGDGNKWWIQLQTMLEIIVNNRNICLDTKIQLYGSSIQKAEQYPNGVVLLQIEIWTCIMQMITGACFHPPKKKIIIHKNTIHKSYFNSVYVI